MWYWYVCVCGVCVCLPSVLPCSIQLVHGVLGAWVIGARVLRYQPKTYITYVIWTQWDKSICDGGVFLIQHIHVWCACVFRAVFSVWYAWFFHGGMHARSHVCTKERMWIPWTRIVLLVYVLNSTQVLFSSANSRTLGTFFSSRKKSVNIEVPNLRVDKGSWRRSACYP